ncbi:hypothetical protein SprV_0802565900 [Sparganum proliferum]
MSFMKNCLRRQAQPRGPSSEEEIVTQKFFSLPYMQGTSEMIARQLNQFGIRVSHKPASSLRTVLTRVKDSIPKEEQTNVIYRIPCANCPCVYVGHTGRRLGTRINKHKLAIRRRDPLSLIFAHALQCDRRFNWDNTEVIATANTKRAREFLEAWHSNADSINRHVDLDAHYEGLRSRLTKPSPTPHQRPLIQAPAVLPTYHSPSPPTQAAVNVLPPPSYPPGSEPNMTPGPHPSSHANGSPVNQQLTILSYDAKFSTRDARPKDFIASFESALQKCEAGEECKNAMRQQVSTLLLQHKRQMTISKAEDRELLKIRKLEDIVTLPADKGRSTVVMDKAEYCTKLGNLLMDKEAYAPSTVSEFKRLVNSINKTIGELRKAGALTRREALAAKASDAAMARFYGLPKVHKPGVPLRPIVSLRVEADEVMVSFDVISLFTSIPPALAIDTIDGFLREKYDETDQQLKRVHIIQLLELCLKTFFTFNGQVYEQKKGTPMGSPLSGLIAEAVLQRLERLVFSSYPPKFWARYVDDTFVIIKRSDVQTFKTLLNSIFPDIQFTMEEELNNTLAFLDVQVTKLEDGKIRTTVYRKATNTRRILHFKSNHPVGHKRSCVRTLFQRVQTHCSDDNGRKEEIKYLHALFKANGYPKSFIRKCLKKPHPERSDGEKPKFWLAIPYVKNVSEATARILKPFGIGVAHKPESTIRQQIMRPKDPLPVTEQSAVVYSIPCQKL